MVAWMAQHISWTKKNNYKILKFLKTMSIYIVKVKLKANPKECTALKRGQKFYNYIILTIQQGS